MSASGAPAAIESSFLNVAAAGKRQYYDSKALEQLLSGPKLMDAPLQHIPLPPEAYTDSTYEQADAADDVVQAVAATAEAASGRRAKLPKVVREYPMPGARETHEMAVVSKDLLVVSQQSNSTLVKVQLHPSTGRPVACASYLVGEFWDGLHGLAASLLHPGHVWASLQFKSLLIRINPGPDLATPPSIVQVIKLPPSVYGPHCVCECDQDLWTSCKDSSHVVRINPFRPHEDYSVYPCSRRPIFIAMHPTSKDFYASLDLSSKVWRLEHGTGRTQEIDIPSNHGSIPVGLVAGPDGNVWFTLLGAASGGTGTFARIFSNGDLQFFSLTTRAGAKAGLIHLAFDWDYEIKLLLKAGGQHHEHGHEHGGGGASTAMASNSIHHLWLLSSSLIASADGYGIDAVFVVVLDGKQERSAGATPGRLISQHSISLPTQRCANHRLLPHRTGLFISQLSISSLAHVSGAAAFKPTTMVGETTDMYNAFGQGKASSQYIFTKYPVSRLINNPTACITTKAISAQPLAGADSTAGHEVLDIKRSGRSAGGGKRSRLMASTYSDDTHTDME